MVAEVPGLRRPLEGSLSRCPQAWWSYNSSTKILKCPRMIKLGIPGFMVKLVVWWTFLSPRVFSLHIAKTCQLHRQQLLFHQAKLSKPNLEEPWTLTSRDAAAVRPWIHMLQSNPISWNDLPQRHEKPKCKVYQVGCLHSWPFGLTTLQLDHFWDHSFVSSGPMIMSLSWHSSPTVRLCVICLFPVSDWTDTIWQPSRDGLGSVLEGGKVLFTDREKCLSQSSDVFPGLQ